MKLVKKNNLGVVVGEIARGVFVTALIGTVAVSLSISCNTRRVKPHIDLADTNGQIVYCIDKNDELSIETLGYDVQSNCIVISDYLTGRIISVTTEASMEQYVKNNNLNNMSEEEIQKAYLSTILRKDCVEVQSISSYIENGDNEKVSKYELKKIINNINENPELYMEEENVKVMVKQ